VTSKTIRLLPIAGGPLRKIILPCRLCGGLHVVLYDAFCRTHFSVCDEKKTVLVHDGHETVEAAVNRVLQTYNTSERN